MNNNCRINLSEIFRNLLQLECLVTFYTLSIFQATSWYKFKKSDFKVQIDKNFSFIRFDFLEDFNFLLTYDIVFLMMMKG